MTEATADTPRMNRPLRFLPAALAALLTFAVPPAAQADDTRPPNIVLILSDDQAWTDYGFMGHPEIRTPNLDRLAEQSLVFERGYVTAPLCRPSLASIVTGLQPFDHGITGNDVDRYNDRARLDIPVKEAFHKHPSVVKLLTENGYLAHQSGKWWEGSYRDGGFTHGMTHGDPARKGRHGDEGLKIGREGMAPVTEFIDLAVAEDRPFFVWYAPFLPHTPHNPPKRLLDKYRKPGRANDVARYFAMCEWFDETCGQLLDHLGKAGVRDNTLVFYICDNGWVSTSVNSADPEQKKWSKYALRSKASPFENGIRTPVMISWPAQVEPGHSDALAQSIDFFPTVAAAAGLEATAGLPGIDLLDPAARAGRDAVYGVTHAVHNMTVGNPDDTLLYLWTVNGDWKLMRRYLGADNSKYVVINGWDRQPVRLYNLAEDPHERNDVSAAHPQKVRELVDAIEAWHPVEGVPVPQ